jgi:3-oxoacyl-[acyl-carrier protein] reductase
VTRAGTDWYRGLVNGRLGGPVSKQLGLPRPAQLRRYRPGQSLTDGPVLIGRTGEGVLADHLHSLLGVEPSVAPDGMLGALVLDATAVASIDDLGQVREFLGENLRRLGRCARVLVLGRLADQADGVAPAAARQALDGLVRSVGKELRDGATANLVLVADESGPTGVDSTVRFLLSARSAFVDGQVVRVGAAGSAGGHNPDGPAHGGRVVVVTGAARGIGAGIAEVFARDGATVVCLDVPGQGAALADTANKIGGLALQLDITAPDAPDRLVHYLAQRDGGLDTIVHNAGVTRDKLLVNMDAARWDAVLAVNLRAQLALNDALLGGGAAGPRIGGRIVSVSSTSGIAGNRGQTNYAGQQGRHHRHGPRAGAGGGRAGCDGQRGCARFHRDRDDRRDAVRHPGGRPADQQPAPGWPAGGRGGDGGLAGRAGQWRRHRPSGPGVRTEHVGGLIDGHREARRRTPAGPPLRVGAAAPPGRRCAAAGPGAGLGRSPGRSGPVGRLRAGLRISARRAAPGDVPQVLAFGVQVQLMTEPGFPLRLPGLVHLRQRIAVRRPIGADEPLELRVRATDLRAHPRGAQVDMTASVSVHGEQVWTARSTYLAKGASAPAGAASPPEPAEVDGARMAARWRLGADTGRRYAAVSGDVNPIHLNPLAAKMFGFPGAIAHGMWSAARCLATLQGRLPELYEVDVVFRKPVVLPAEVELFVAERSGSWHLQLRGAGRDRLHLLAEVCPS